MTGRSYPRLPLVEFGRQLFDTKDLDPIYVALLACKLVGRQLDRWLIAYWCFYHAGLASYASEREGRDFWALLLKAAKNTSPTPSGGRWPRGTERRYFRGEAGVKAVYELRKRYGAWPEDMVHFVLGGPLGVRSVIDRAMQHPLFGPWIGFKVADMVDGVLGAQVCQDDLSVFLYNTPRQSIEENIKNGVVPRPCRSLSGAMGWLQRKLQECHIPHKPKSTPDWFSLETVWCKHLSHMHGHYPMYKDIEEIRHGLEPWTEVSKTARQFLKCMPAAPEPEREGFLWL